MSLLIAALTGWDKVLIIGATSVGGYFAILLLIKAYRLLLLAIWKLLPTGRLKYALFKERGRPDHSMINPNDPWVQAQWIKKSHQRANRINAPAEFIPGERADPRSETRQQGPESRR